MAEESKGNSSTKHLFDDSDESDSDEDLNDKNDNLLKDQAKTKNSQLFGSDDSDSDEDLNSNNNNNKQNDNNMKENKEDESDVEFEEKDADIVGRKAPTPPPTVTNPTEGNTSSVSSSSYKHIAVMNHAVPQVENKNVSLHMAQLPKILGIQSEAYSSWTYNAAIEDVEFKGRMASVIRWRYIPSKNGGLERDPDTNRLKKESNAKIIKWSDGTYGLVVGEEVFDMDEFSYLQKGTGKKKVASSGVPSMIESKAKDYLYMTQKAKAILDETTQETRNVGTILQAVSQLTSKFIPRPASLQSAAHKTFVLHERSKVMKRAKIAEYVTFVDPEKQKAERIRNKEDLIKQEKRSGEAYKVGGKKRIGMYRNYLEDEDDDRYDSVNIKRLKRGDDEDMDYGSDESEEEDEWIQRKTKRGPGYGRKNVDNNEDEMESEEDMDEDDKDSQDDEDEKDEEDVDVDEDDEEEINVRKKPTETTTTKRKAPAIFDDDDDDDSE